MLNLKSDWLKRGYFVLTDHPVMPAIKDRLGAALGGPFLISAYPQHASWRTTIWWHQREGRYTEAQFFMRVAEEYPILSFGVSVEKGLEDRSAVPTNETDWLMADRREWDWQRLMEVAPETIAHDVPEVSAVLDSSIDLRVFASRREHGVARDREQRSFVFHQDQWWERHVGTASPQGIVEYLRQLDQRPDWWVDLYFACDLHPSEVDGITASAAADMLLTFAGLRSRLNRRC